MIQVNQPQKKDNAGKILGVAGGVVGGIYGGPQGAMAGYQVGSSVGGLLGNKERTPEDIASTGLTVAQGVSSMKGGSAMERRLNMKGGNSDLQMAPKSQNNSMQELQDARLALQSQPPEVRQQYEAPIIAAMMKQRRSQQMG